ncbi:hypothetical protein CHS0354_022649 [Potamilus streckersoni]|uniref:Phospholipase A2-like central domain-containing protein n=1 Tax=Potamilus streckersoni TaxID=2493646 RepID=A0AAE0TG49_9BIVA|nr:hypothetical protein CHS0354_022649 [Potamilus streckersoni]
MLFGFVTGLLIVAISINIGNVECGIKRAEAGPSLLSESEDISSVEERFLDNLRPTWDVITNTFKGIYPGTKWCGIGKAAKNDSDFGTSLQTDICCKQHDGCEIYITAFRSRYGLRNYSPYTVSGCDCDKTFLQCMTSVVKSETVPANDKKTAKNFGHLFFNIINPKCLEMDYPLVCVRKGLLGFCKEYQHDTSKPKVWQLVKGPKFNPK